jgi:hypothetical protein
MGIQTPKTLCHAKGTKLFNIRAMIDKQKAFCESEKKIYPSENS